MPSIKEIIEIENNREDSFCIHLFAEGAFWRAYEMSAWLCVRCIHEFKVTKKQLNGIESPICFIGFPQTSFEKWVNPEMKVDTVDEKHIAIYLNEESIHIPEEGNLRDLFAIWKDNLELTISNKRSDKEVKTQNSSTQTNGRLTDIMRDVLAFPLESTSPIDCMIFLAEIKKRLSQII